MAHWYAAEVSASHRFHVGFCFAYRSSTLLAAGEETAEGVPAEGAAAGAAVAVEAANAGASVARALTATRGARRRLCTISILPVSCSDRRILSDLRTSAYPSRGPNSSTSRE
ncbi:hypothetical protein ASD97_35150 [Streptomyces sp. Root63]|nr:hypothetical protein ASD97_35150 [Streptomyces sp. Root63]